MDDYIIRATAACGTIRAFAARTTDTVSMAQKIHGLYPVASAALGRVLTAAAMMGIDLKGKRDTLSIIIKGGGPIGNVVAVATSHGTVKGYVGNPHVNLPLNKLGKLDVAGAVGRDGDITVIKDLGLKEPYVGRTKLVSGEIAEDVAYYFTVSEQQPSAVALGVLVNPDCSVSAAGGFIIQPMPGASEDIISAIEKTLASISPVSMQINEGKSPEEMLESLLGKFDIKFTEKIKVYYHCDCNRERLEEIIMALGEAELKEIVEKDKKAEVVCHYCNKKYYFNEVELKKLLENIKDKK